MTSQIVYNTIDETYPVAGKDNDSQGFRDNFAYIKSALTVANSEISNLQEKAVLKQSLTSTASVTNDLFGSTITNGNYSNLRGAVSTATAGVVYMINAPLQKYTVTASGPLVLHIAENSADFPDNDQLVLTRIHLISDTQGDHTLQISAASGQVKYDEDFPLPTVVQSGKEVVFDAWTTTASSGTKIYIKHVGTFTL